MLRESPTVLKVGSLLQEQEMALFEKYRDGSITAKYKLLDSLNPIITSQVNKYAGSGLPPSALKLEAKRLTNKAIQSYDPNKAQLNTHVINNLKKLSRFVMNYQNIGHIPEPRVLMIGKYNTIYDNLEADLGREPTIVELADAMQVNVTEIERLQIELRKDLSMTTPGEDDEGGFYFYAQPAITDPAKKQAVEFVYYDSDPINKKIIEYMFP